nr:uncharaterized LOC112694756 homolog isoform X1 [Zootoca vivipara]XP_034990619.1 uncharaterized LOC112694756 homolog isoform X1 [Zootoca vivipara]XP_034990620.1 uncharaterized LOC112694756 homolog isoform X1 [Zootoca vivipara]XP_034990621.1 uncharaterized LOC112694756 homolog isoform X1 [Zootoca vivipara]XP_034990622.1 uncharaterized LOC112694756 homolog isoform X1 [Zootoca vivipara]
MATPSLNPPPDLPFATTLFLPLPAIIFLVVGSYLLLLALVLVLRQCLMARGLCANCCSCEKRPWPNMCECCLTCAESCDCALPSPTRCMDRYCTCTNQGWEPGACSFPRLCPLCDCACTYQPPDCQNINCICFEIKLR